MGSSEEFVKSHLAPYEQKLREAVDAAWAEYLTIPIRHKFRFARTRANIVFDLIVGHLFSKFDGDASVKIKQKDETVKLLIGPLVVRVKKANGSGLGANIKTQAVLEFVKQQPEIPGLLPEIYKVEICYVEDDTGAEIKSVSVTSRDHDVKLWSYDIDRPDDSIVDFPESTLPITGGGADEAEVIPRIPDTSENSDDE
jgi:hypothetical protein